MTRVVGVDSSTSTTKVEVRHVDNGAIIGGGVAGRRLEARS